MDKVELSGENAHGVRYVVKATPQIDAKSVRWRCRYDGFEG
jgi:hypothetical protein